MKTLISVFILGLFLNCGGKDTYPNIPQATLEGYVGVIPFDIPNFKITYY